MHSPLLAPPSFLDLSGLLVYVLSNPYLFVSSSTVITTGLVVLVLTLGSVGALASAITSTRGHLGPAIITPLRWLAPKLTLVLLYFGLGSMALATYVFLKFHASIPEPVEIQFRSGIGHLAVAAAGIAVALPLARTCSRRQWLEANFWALGYWTLHVVLLTPPWFLFQGQGVSVMRAVTGALALGYAITAYLWSRERPADRY